MMKCLKRLYLIPVNLFAKGLFWIAYGILKGELKFHASHPDSFLLISLREINKMFIWVLNWSCGLIAATQEE